MKTQHQLSGSETYFFPWPWTHGIGSNNCYAYSMNDFRRYRKWKSTPGDKRNDTDPSFNYASCGRLPERTLKDNPKNMYIHHSSKMSNSNYYKPCKRGYYKVILLVAPPKKGQNRGDFHFVKHNKGIQHIILKTDMKKPVGSRLVSKREIVIHNVAKLYGISKKLVRKYLPMVDPVEGLIFTIPLNMWSQKLGWATMPMFRDASGKLITDPRKSDMNFQQNYKKYCTTFCVKKNKPRVGVSSNKNLQI